MLHRVDVKYKWFPATPRDNKLSPFINMQPGETVIKTFRTNDINKLYLEICDQRPAVDSLRYARAFDIAAAPSVVYLSGLKQRPIESVDPELINQTHDIILSFVAIFGIWYHFLTRKKLVARIVLGAAGLIVTVIGGYILYSSALVFMYYY
jgi:hypothetical protein